MHVHTVLALLSVLGIFGLALTATRTTTIKVPGLPALPAELPVTITADFEAAFEFDIPANAVGHVSFGSIDKTKIKLVVLNSTQPGNCATNAADGTGGQVIPLVKGKSFYWDDTLDPTSFPNPITNNITALYFDNTANNVVATLRAGFEINL
jgi:hypothetical protein